MGGERKSLLETWSSAPRGHYIEVPTTRLRRRKRKPGAGRKPSLTQGEVERGIRILRDQPKMKVTVACVTLRRAGIKGKDTMLYELIVRPAYRASLQRLR